jgi:hypothetical protein
MRKKISLATLFAAVALALPVNGLAQHNPVAPGHPLKKGATAPSFTLKDQNGQDQSLDAMLKSGKVAVIFHRSADW